MCTAIKIDYKDGCVMGRTMDFEVPINYNVSYLPRSYNFSDDLMGQALYSKYKILGVCFEDRTPIKDGVNEHGLVGVTNAFGGFNLYPKQVNEGKLNVSSLNFLTYVLGNYENVEQLIEDLPNIHISSKDHKGEDVITPDFHHMFTDSSKRIVVIEPKKREIVYHENPYNVMTNSPHLESHVRRLNKLMDIDNLEGFNSAKDLPGGYDPFSRFAKAFYLTQMNVEAKTCDQAFSNFYNIMSAMTMPEGFVRNKKYNEITYTRYTCSYDTKDKLLTVKSHTNPIVYQIGFDDIENKDERQSFFLESEFKMQKLK